MFGIAILSLLLLKVPNIFAQSMRLQDAPLGSVIQIGSFNYIKIAENKYMQSSAVTCPDLAKVGNKYVKCYDTYEEAASGGSCACGTGYVFDGSYKSGIGACKLSCGIYSSIDSDNPFSCNCDSGYYVDSSYTKTSYNTIKTSCSYLKCGALSSQTSGNNSSCTCTSGYSVDADWKTTSYTNVGGKCTYLICGEHSYQNTTNVLQCDCESGWTYTGGKSSYTAVGGACDQNCPAGTIYSDADKACKAVCGDGTSNLVYDGDNPICDFDYTGGIQTFTAAVAGTYKLEVWGASGGGTASSDNYKNSPTRVGLGGYTVAEYKMTANNTLAVVVGGVGETSCIPNVNVDGGYNGGGLGRVYKNNGYCSGGGGGATHIAIYNANYSVLSSYNNTSTAATYVLVVGGGGGGMGHTVGAPTQGGHGGGVVGGPGYNHAGNTDSSTTGGNQTSGASFGKGGNAYLGANSCAGGGGGGWYGGKAFSSGGCAAYGGGGGSAYVNTSMLVSGTYGMYCYDGSSKYYSGNNTGCLTGTNTIRTSSYSEIPTSNYAKQGNGYARITLISVD